MISTQRKSAEIRRFNKKTIAPTYRFILPYRFFVFQKRKQPAGEAIHSRLFLTNKTEKIMSFLCF